MYFDLNRDIRVFVKNTFGAHNGRQRKSPIPAAYNNPIREISDLAKFNDLYTRYVLRDEF
jgi:hypothetical protein